MTEQELKDYVFSLVKEHGGQKAKEILSDEIDKEEGFELMLASAKYGHHFIQAIEESENTLLS